MLHFVAVHRLYLRSQALATIETEFLDVIGTKILRVFVLASHSHLPLLTEFETDL
jgi:hypothetical protein